MQLSHRPAVWAGVEPSHLTIHGRRRDQLVETGHASRLDDLDRLAELGIRAVRYPILWGWGGPETDWDWARIRLDRLASLGIAPVVGLLHHGWGPDGIDPLEADYPARFAAYAVQVARRFPEIRTFLPINEPLTTARFAGLYGWWDPQARDDETFMRLIVGQCLAIRASIQALRRIDPSVETMITEDSGETFGTPELADVVSFYNQRRWLTFDLLTGRVDRFHPMWNRLTAVAGLAEPLRLLADDPAAPDVLGLDHYVNSDRFLDHRIDLYPPRVYSDTSAVHFVDVELARVAGHELDGFQASLRQTWERYRLPMALAEVHLGGAPDDEVFWWAEAWGDATAAGASGIPVVAVTSWAAFGSYDWDSLLRVELGAYRPGCFDISRGTPILTPLGRAVAETAAGRPPAPVGSGWWRQPSRLAFPALPTAAA